jgi:hypothetical protein
VAQGNDYLITVKGNQPKLMQQFQQACATMTPHAIRLLGHHLLQLLSLLASPSPSSAQALS